MNILLLLSYVIGGGFGIFFICTVAVLGWKDGFNFLFRASKFYNEQKNLRDDAQ